MRRIGRTGGGGNHLISAANDVLRMKRGKCPLPLHSSFLHLVFAIAMLCIAATVRAADWTDANGVAYTALQSISGGGSGVIITDIKPSGTETVRFKFVPKTVSGNEFIYCCRYKSGGKWYNHFSGLRYAARFRIDRYSSQPYCTTHNPLVTDTAYSVAVDYGAGTVAIDGEPETLSAALGTDSYTPGGSKRNVIVLFASYDLASGTTPTESYSFGNKSTGDLYYFQLWSASGALEHNLMPAMRDSDSAVGFYDTVTRMFWPASVGSFTDAPRSAVTGTPVKWTGAGDGVTMSSGANWEGGNPPQEGDDLDFTIAVPNAEINADINATFGKLWLGDGDGPVFTGSLSVTSVNDGTKVRGAVTIVAYYNWNGSGANWSDAGAWTFDGAPVSWSDGVNAVFGMANATATLTADASANSLSFTQPATVSGQGALTVSSVSVASGVSATIAAPTEGSLEKTGGGTLTLGSPRTSATVLSEGALKMAPGATVSALTLGTDDATKPITFDYGGQTLTALPSTYLVAGSSVTLTNGTFMSSGTVNIRNDTLNDVPAVLTVAKDTTFGKSDAANYLVIMNKDGTATVNVAGGSLISEYTTYFQHSAETGTLRINVTDGGLVSLDNSLYALCCGSFGASPSLYMKVVDSTFRVGNSGSGNFKFGNHTTAPVKPTGVFAATNSTIYVGSDFILGRQDNETGTEGSYTADFESCVVTGRSFVVDWDRPLNRARFNGTRYVFRADSASFTTCDGDAKWITVDTGGLVIDTQNYSANLAANLGGVGTVTKVGEGTLTVTLNQTASAALAADEGTLALNHGISVARPVSVASGATLKFLGEASLASLSLAAESTNDVAVVSPITLSGAMTLPASGTVALTFNGGAFPVGIYRLFSYAGVAAADGEKFAPDTDGETAAWSVVNGALTLTVGNPPNTWIGGATGSLSDQSNWSLGIVPGRGDTAAIGTGSAATFTAGASFCPDVIIIPEGSADVTFSGENAITGIATVTNLSGGVCTFEMPVAFADEINVYQTAYYYLDSSSNSQTSEGGHVRFAGGVTGTSFAEGTSRRLDGAYSIPATAGWRANDSTEELWTLPGRTTAVAGSSLTITGSTYETPGTTDTSRLFIGTGSAFTTGVVRTSNRVSYRIYGEYVVTEEMEVVASGNLDLAYRYSEGKYKFEKLTLGDTGRSMNFWISTANSNSYKKHLYIGAGGINFANGVQPATTIVLGHNDADEIWLYPWHSDYTVGGKDGSSTRDIIIHKPSHIVTDDENGVARTVTIEGIADVRDRLDIDGHGTVAVNRDGFSSSRPVGDIFVNDYATLAFAPGTDLGGGAITVDTNATLKVAGSGTVTVAGGLTLEDGATLAFSFTDRKTAPTLAIADGAATTANGSVTVKLDGVHPKSGAHILTTCGGFDAEGVTVTLAADAPDWAPPDCLTVNANGNLVLTVKSKGTMIFVR